MCVSLSSAPKLNWYLFQAFAVLPFRQVEARRRRHPSLPDLEFNPSESDSVEIRFHLIGNSSKTAWTNEKHDLYLDHLESSFVKQLHRSILKKHPKRAGKQCFVRATKMQDSTNGMSLFARDNNSFSNEAGISTGQTFERHGKSLNYFEEFSDQNFPDEANEPMCVTMRSKTIVS